MNRLSQLRLIAALVALQLLTCRGTLASQGPQGQPLGALSTRGEVYVNQLRVAGDLTLFAGETLRTGTDGAAALTISGRGTLIISPQTEISFVSDRRYFASLAYGDVGLRSVAGARNFQIRIGNFVVVPVEGAEAVVEIVRATNVSARISCSAGSVGVIALEGPESVFLRAGQSITISAEGALIRVPPTPPTPSPPAPAGKKKSHTGLIIVGVAGGGAAGAAAALASRGKGQPVSPSSP